MGSGMKPGSRGTNGILVYVSLLCPYHLLGEGVGGRFLVQFSPSPILQM